MKDNYRKLYIELKEKYDSLYKSINPLKLKPASGEFRETQQELLDFTKKVLKQIEHLNLNYFLVAGSLIGAIRHKGFIPWDDDIDIGLIRDDYLKLLQFCRENYIEIPPDEIRFGGSERECVRDKYLQKYKNKMLFSQTPHHLQVLYGESIKNCQILDFFSYEYISKEISLEEYIELIKQVKEKKQALKNYQKILDYYEEERKTNKIFIHDSNRLYAALDNIDNYILPVKGFYTYDMIFPTKKIKFEDMELPIPNKEGEFLKLTYPDFMEMPDDIELSFHALQRNIFIEEESSIFFHLKKALYNIISHICKLNINEQNDDEKILVLDIIRDFMFAKKSNYKNKYNELLLKYEFLKSIV